VTLALLLSGQSYSVSDLDTAFGKNVLVISASQHACHRFEVWIAATSGQHSRGLMHVRKLPKDAGMLFVYQDPGRRSMWMKNTYIPLDMLFIRRDGAVSSVVAHTEPLSLRSVSSIEPVTFVLELNAGTTERLHIDIGSHISWDSEP
jgi:uncharacterized membrane protein (UPF0127 family)